MIAASAVGRFDQLGFASQMIVWATRKRLHSLASGDDDDKVVEAFGIAGFDAIHDSLMRVIDVLLCGVAARIHLHAVACPCLAPYEVSLLNALAYLQQREQPAAERCLAQLFGAAAIRLVQPALCAIVNDFDDRELGLTLVSGSERPVVVH